jgi:transcriptional regulator with XRE-family HTH domain
MKDKNLVLFASRIKQIRKALGLNQKDLAKSIDLPKTSVSEYESGITKPTFYFFFNISKIHNVNLRYLLHGEGRMFKGENVPKIAIDDDELKEMLYYLQIPALKLSLMAQYDNFKIVFKPMIDEFETAKNDKKEHIE